MIESAGIGTYLQNLLPKIIYQFSNIKFNLIGNKEILNRFGWTQKKNIELVHCIVPIYSIKEQLELIIKVPKQTDLFWAPNYNIPLQLNCKLLATIHDLNHLALKQINYGLLKRLYARLMFNQVKKTANATIYISEFSKNEFNKYIGKPFADQFVTLLGINNDWYKIPLDKPINPKPFILYVGNVKPHKNLGTLIEAFGLICDKIPHDLVIVGKKDGFITGDNTLAKKSKNYPDRIIFTGLVPDKDLKQYFRQADVFVFPSLYEGFGFPPLEAMAAGTPVISSNAASIPEVCGNAALYFDPYDIDDMAEKILKMISDQSVKTEYIKRGKKQIKEYTWEKTTSQTFDIIQNLLTRS